MNVDEVQRKLWEQSKEHKEHREAGRPLFPTNPYEKRIRNLMDLMHQPDWLCAAMRKVLKRSRNKAAGVDKITAQKFIQNQWEELEKTTSGTETWYISTSTVTTSGDTESQRQNAPAWYSLSAGQNCSRGDTYGTRTDLRDRISRKLLWIPTQSKYPPRGSSMPESHGTRLYLGHRRGRQSLL